MCTTTCAGSGLCGPRRSKLAFRVSEHATRVAGVPDNYFDVWVAHRYEALWPHLFDPEVVEPAVSFLADLAGDGRALELGIGTGRLALPLSRRGIRVNGIDLSPAMLEQLRSQPGSADVDVTIGDFSTTKANGTFNVAVLGAQHDHEPDDTGRGRSSASAMLQGIWNRAASS